MKEKGLGHVGIKHRLTNKLQERKMGSEKDEERGRNERQSEVEACGGLWAGAAAASAESDGWSSLR